MEKAKNYSMEELVKKRENWVELLSSLYDEYVERSYSEGEISPEMHVLLLSVMDCVHQIDWGGFFPEEFILRKDE